MITLTPFVLDEHKELLINWLRRPHVQAAWGDPEKNIAELLQPTPTVTRFLIMEGRTPVGLLQWQWLGANDLAETGLNVADEQTIDIDIFIAEIDRLGKGIGSKAIHTLMAQLRTSTQAKRVTLFTGFENKAAIRAYEKCGFACRAQYEDAEHGWTWVMVADL